MCSVRVTISASDRKDVERHVKTAPHLGHVRQVTYLLAILAVIDGQSVAQVALVWRVHAQTVATWGQRLCCSGLQGAPRHTPTGRPPTLPPTPHAALATWMEAGPGKAGCRGACGRSPRGQQRMVECCGGYDQVFSSVPLLKNCGVSSQHAAWVSDQREAQKRQAWRTTTWPQLGRHAQARKALRLLGAAAACPPWGPLPSTWARRGQHPQGTTSGKRNG